MSLTFVLSAVWIAAAVTALVVEMATQALVSIWFSVGALGALLVCLCHGSWLLQAAVFLALSLLCFLVVHRWAAERLPLPDPSPLDLEGSEGVVIQASNGVQAGRVQVNGRDWRAQSLNGQPLRPGQKVRVQSLQGVTLWVTLLDDGRNEA